LPEDDQARLREFNEVLVKACESDASRRYSSTRQVHEDLGLLQRGKSVRQKRTAEQRWAIARKLAFAAAAAALVVATLLFSSSRHYAPDPEAVRLYKEGQWHYNELAPEAHEKAFDYLNRALRADPKFVQPYGELMALYTWLMMPGITNEQMRLERVREIADKALAINPNSPEGHTALSWCRFLERD
jgi:tetratricopeptide (TPR) repeat protein